MSLSRHTKPKRHTHHFVQLIGPESKDYLVSGYAVDRFAQTVKPYLHRDTRDIRGMGNLAHVESFRAELFVLFGLRTRVVTFHLPRRPKWAPPKYPSLEPTP